MGNVNDNQTGIIVNSARPIIENPARQLCFLSILVQLTRLGAAKVLHFVCVCVVDPSEQEKEEENNRNIHLTDFKTLVNF